jgi:cellulose synthase/poly-beta-1,6-N-acetylglucosamine synthase-like glycosyltransferase/4-amino-4-deoxy-L-arabinose transferase-like glycosyltransferase
MLLSSQRRPALSARACLVLVVLENHAGADGVATLDDATIADCIGTEIDVIGAAVDELERTGRIVVLRRAAQGHRRVTARVSAGRRRPRRQVTDAVHRVSASGTTAIGKAVCTARAVMGLLADRSARRVAGALPPMPRLKLVVALALLLAVVAAAVEALGSGSLLYLGYLSVSLVLSVVAWTTLMWMLTAWTTPASLADGGFPDDDVQVAHSFSLIVPARHEEMVLEATLSKLVMNEHPAFEILVVVGDDDPETRQVAERVARRHPSVVKVLVDSSTPKSKPKALNTALPHCAGDITGVFDAEDDVHPGLLRRVDQRFQRSNADVVQAGVQLMNFRSSWLTVRNVLEYYFWFRSRLHRHAAQGFIPLGGNTVFVRTDVLRAVSGWDAECLAEDCELGVRLSSLGARTVVVYEPQLVTREECPPTVRAFARQRTRWNQGYLQTLSRGYWRRLPPRQRVLGLYILATPYLMAVAWVLMPAAIATAVAVKAPVPITLVSFLPALPMLSMLTVELVGLAEFCRAYGERASIRDYGRLVVGLPAYQAVLAYAAARAVVREARGNRGWEKTAHMGLHLGTGAARPEGEALSVARPQPAMAGVAASAPQPVMTAVTDDPPSEPWLLHRGGPPSDGLAAADELPAVHGGDPLWVRLHGVAGDGSVSLSMPTISAPGVAVPGAVWWVTISRLLRQAVRAHPEGVTQLLLLTFVGLVFATNLENWPATQFDEGTYVGDAWAVHRGALAPYTYSYGHPPLAWLCIALWTWLGGIVGHGTYSINSGREFMFVIGSVSCALLYTLGRRLGLSRGFAAAAVILFALSPVSVFFHRAVLLDNPAIAWALAAFVLARTPSHRLWAFAGSGACFAACVLSKETMLVLLPALMWAAAQNSDRRTRHYCLMLLCTFLVLIGLSYPLYATLKGELVPGPGHVSLLGYVKVQLVTRQSTGSIFDPQSAGHGTVMTWLHLDSWLLGAALALSPLALASRSTRAVALAFLIQVVMVLRPGYLPNMYVIGLLPFAALIVAGVAQTMWNTTGRIDWRVVRLPLKALVVAAAVSGILVVAPRWVRGDRQAMTAQSTASQRAAERWLLQHVGHDKRLIVGDEFWIYLIEHGFDDQAVRGGFFSRTVVSYWPLDYDPAVKRRFPHGWRNFDYVISTAAVRITMNRTPTTAEAISHSRVVAQFGHGYPRVEIRAITPTRAAH